MTRATTNIKNIVNTQGTTCKNKTSSARESKTKAMHAINGVVSLQYFPKNTEAQKPKEPTN